MYTLEFTLKQHTPLIHFQYFLSDATLRSTEFKSALDKFIIGELCQCWSSDKTERLNAVVANDKYKLWLKHSEKPSNPSFDFDVELNVIGTSNQKIIQVNDLKKYGFFGNQPTKKDFKDKAKYKKGVFEHRNIQLIIKSTHQELLNEINKLIAKFFLLKNFGTRQSKGFGCFYPIEKYYYFNNQEYLPYYFDVSENDLDTDGNKYRNVFQIITLFYNTLRTGINIPNHDQSDSIFYFKSLMWAYAKSKSEHWDKKSIKNEYKSGSFASEDTKWKANSKDYKNTPTDFPLGYSDSNANEKQRHLWRDLLGLSTDENWGVKKVIIDNSKITRFKSPIIFKPILVGENKYRVFFGIDPALCSQFNNGSKNNTESEILGKVFKVKFNGSGNLKLKYHDKFDYAGYLKFAINTYNSSTNWVESKFHFTNEFQIIDFIYKQLKGQVK